MFSHVRLYKALKLISILYENNDMVLEIIGLKNVTTGAYINNATVSVTIYKEDGSQEANGTWPLSMSYVANTRGNYRTVIGGYLDLTEGEKVDVVISANGSGIEAEFNCNVKIKKRC